ncbi:aminopeptidase N [Microbacterium azadirachtae]|uniref:Aminopeptidase N n=1 Tax=Microbacterium azadirachtae TaxID=582680 RepID=A0A1I6G409_9MICO|nr:aminopeptidase N [Microbacterium azadirachtae]SFR36935.1 aminopeptidase N [Microbacterium azadirachtae]
MTTANLTRAETSARSASITLRRIRLELDVADAADAATTGFPTTSTLEFDATTTETWVDFIGEDVREVVLNGRAQDVDWDGARIRLTGLAAHNTAVIRATGAYSRSGEGLHRFADPVDGKVYLYTHDEPADARRFMACFEQPDMKAPLTVVVTAPEGWEVLANQSPVSVRTGAGRQTVEFAPTLPLSSYLTCIAAGPYVRVSSEWRRDDLVVPLSVLSRASMAEHLAADEILEVTRQGLDFFAEAFSFPYPWGKYDQIFVPEYNIGAMENPGLVTFTESYLYRGAATRAQRQARANTILHEMAHMWFGDLVTMRWWDDLWLKESFADYMGAHASVAATEFTDAWVAFANRRKAWAYTQDQLPSTHPIVADIADLEAAKLNFDGITYAKGAAVLKQLVAFVGEEAFFDGARRYFARHAYGNTTLEDLLVELEDASGRDMRAWAQAWLQTTGMSTLAIERGADGTAVVVQSDPRPHRLQIGLYELRGDALALRERIPVDIAEERTSIALPDADLVLLNDGDLTYAKARLDDRSLAAVERGLSSLDDPLARGLMWSALWNATRDGDLAVARYLDIVRAHAPAETDGSLLGGVVLNAATAIGHYLPGRDRTAERRAWLDTTWRALGSAPAAGDAQLIWARAFAAAASFDDARRLDVSTLLIGAGPEGLPMDADLRWELLTALVTTGHAGAEEITEEHLRDHTASGRTAALAAAASTPNAAVRAADWRAAWGDLTLSNDHLDATIRGFGAGGRRDLVEAFDEEYFTRIESAWAERSIEIARRLVIGLYPETETTELVDAWLDAHPQAPAALRRIVLEQRDHQQRAIRVRDAQGALVG